MLHNKKLMVLLDQAVFSGSSFVFVLLLARILDIDHFGLYSGHVLALYALVSMVGAFVIQPFQVLMGKEQKLRPYTTFAFWFQLIVIALIELLALGFHILFPQFYPLAFLCFAAGFIFHDFSRRILLALDRPSAAFILDLINSILSLLALSLFYTNSSEGLGALYVLLGMANGFSIAVLMYILKPFGLDRNRLNRFLTYHIKEGKWFFLTAVSQWWSGNLFVVASGVYLGAAALGALRLAQSLLGVLNLFLQSFENYVLPQTSLRVHTAPHEAVTYATGLSRKLGFVFIPIILFIFVFASAIMALAGGPAYVPYAYALQGMSILYLLVYLSQSSRLLIRAFLLNRHFFYGYLISLGFALGFAHYFLSTFGLIGAIVGLGISQIILIVYWSFVLHKNNILVWKSFIS